MSKLDNKARWSDAEMLAALDMRDRCGMSAAVIAGKLGRSRSSVLGVFKRSADDEAAAEAPREAAE